MTGGPDWFAPKRFGYGSGLPIAWQGWAVLTAYAAVVVAGALLLQANPMAMASVVLLATVILFVLAARTTRGGWRWRWGGDD